MTARQSAIKAEVFRAAPPLALPLAVGDRVRVCRGGFTDDVGDVLEIAPGAAMLGRDLCYVKLATGMCRYFDNTCLEVVPA